MLLQNLLAVHLLRCFSLDQSCKLTTLQAEADSSQPLLKDTVCINPKNESSKCFTTNKVYHCPKHKEVFVCFHLSIHQSSSQLLVWESPGQNIRKPCGAPAFHPQTHLHVHPSFTTANKRFYFLSPRRSLHRCSIKGWEIIPSISREMNFISVVCLWIRPPFPRK